jgi:hypothetical protein
VPVAGSVPFVTRALRRGDEEHEGELHGDNLLPKSEKAATSVAASSGLVGS